MKQYYGFSAFGQPTQRHVWPVKNKRLLKELFRQFNVGLVDCCVLVAMHSKSLTLFSLQHEQVQLTQPLSSNMRLATLVSNSTQLKVKTQQKTPKQLHTITISITDQDVLHGKPGGFYQEDPGKSLSSYFRYTP